MFRYEIAHWTKTLSILTMNIMNTLAALAAVRASPMLRPSHRSKPIIPERKIDLRSNMAVAMAKVSRLNR
jgi:hypothetical protein